MRNRTEIPAELKWDFTHIFKTKEDWEKAYSEVESEISALSALKGTLGESADSLAKAYDTLFGFYEKFEPVADYAFLKKTIDGGDSEAQAMGDRVNMLAVKASSAAALFDPELMEIPEEKLAEFMKSDNMKKYAHIVEDATRLRAYVLDEKSEGILAMMGKITGTPSDAYGMFTDVEMQLPKIKDSNGKEYELSSGNFTVMRESSDRALRENAFEAMFGTYGKYINTIACLYSGSVKQDNVFAQIRGYKSAREASLAGSNVPEAVYDALVEAIHASIPTMSKYLKLRKKALGLEKLDVYDLYTPMVADIEYPMPYEKACEIVIEAVAPLGKDYQDVIRRAINENWIDVYETPGKESGAFSAGVYGVHPFVKLNYSD